MLARDISKIRLNEHLNPDGATRSVYQALVDTLSGLGVPELRRRWRNANDRAALDAFTFMLDPREFRTIPTDWIPRLIPADEWETISRGVAQRLKAINQFLWTSLRRPAGGPARRHVLMPVLQPLTTAGSGPAAWMATLRSI